MRLLMIGCGNMGYAMLKAWLATKKVEPANCAVVEPNEALRERAATHGIVAFEAADALPSGFDVDLIVFAVKPQIIRDVLPAYRKIVSRGAAVVSIAAGTPIRVFEGTFGTTAAIIRCMPNTPAAIGAGVMALVANETTSQAQLDAVHGLLEANGTVVPLDDEGQMDAVTAVSGSGPAYVFHFIECLEQAAIHAGLPHEKAAVLARQTVLGAARLAQESGEEPGELRRQVTSPNGTTAAALDVFMHEDALSRLVNDAVDAARKRSIALQE